MTESTKGILTREFLDKNLDILLDRMKDFHVVKCTECQKIFTDGNMQALVHALKNDMDRMVEGLTN